MLLSPPRFGAVASGRAWMCALVLLLWAHAGGAWAAPDAAPGAVVAQADPAAEELEAEADAGGSYVAPPSDVEVIRIKGRSVEAIQTDVPESVTQFDAAEIEALGAQNISDLAKVTPNVEIKTAGATAPTFFIRGVGLSDFSANAAGSVAIYQDDVAINAAAMQLGVLFDIENVEIIRGPKGYGSTRNDAAGAIKIYTRRPTGELTAGLRSSIGRFNLRDFEGHIEAPIVDEVLSARLAFRLIERDGYVLNRCSPGGAVDYPFKGNPDGLSPALFPPDNEAYTQPVRPSAEGTRGYVGSNLPQNPGVPPQYVGVRVINPAPPTVAVPASGTPVIDPSQRPQLALYPANAPAYIYSGVQFCGEGLRSPKEYRENVANPGTVQTLGGGAPRVFGSPFAVSELGAGLAEDMNDIGTWAARGQVRYQPRDVDMDWILKLHGGRLDQLSTVGQAMGTKGAYLGAVDQADYEDRDITAMKAAIPGFQPPPTSQPGSSPTANLLARELADNLDIHPWRGDYNRTGQTTLDVWGASLRGDWDLGPANLRAVTAYDAYTRFRDQDQDFTPNVLFESIGTDSAWQVFQEVELSGELEDSPFTWSVGGYYLFENLSFVSETQSVALSARATRSFEQETRSFAFYAGFSWDFLDDFTLEGGVRYQWNRAGFVFNLSRIGAVPPTFDSAEIWQAPTGGLRLSYRFTEDSNIYWKYTRGWKPGTWNSSTNVQRGVDAADPVQIDAWETGLRGSWFDGRFSAGGALFYYRYVDYQVFVVLSEVGTAPTLSVLNADDAEVYGAELDFRLEPLVGWAPGFLDGLVVSGRAGWLQSEFLEFTNQIVQRQGFVGGPILSNVDYAGNPIINAPRFKVSGTTEWTFDLGRYGSITPRYDFAWSDAISFGPNDSFGTPNIRGETFLPEHAIGQRAFWLHNLRLMYRTPEGNTEIALWVRNLENLAYKTYGFDASSFQNVVINFVGEPRTFGIDITFNW